jgi:hypothetical protein
MGENGAWLAIELPRFHSRMDAMVKDMAAQYSQTSINRSRQRLSAGLIIRQKEPVNLETPIRSD